MRILLVEDDRMIATAVQEALRDEGYSVDHVTDGAAAREALMHAGHALVLLDLGLPRLDGIAVLNGLRRRGSSVPVLILTARDAVEDRIRGLDAGADDYLVKPFATGELLARMRSLIRRHHGTATPLLGTEALSLDPLTHEARTAENSARLSAREYALLHALLVRPGAVLSRADLEERVYGWGEEVESNAIEFLIHGLRKKLGRESIRNLRGVGWMVPKA